MTEGVFTTEFKKNRSPSSYFDTHNKASNTEFSESLERLGIHIDYEEMNDFLHPFFDPAKILAHRRMIDRFLHGKSITPITVELHPTNLCNHNCVWCFYKEFRYEEYSTVSRKALFRIAEDIGALRAKAIVISGGGEPLLHPDLIELIERLGKTQVELGVVTNGSLLNDHFVRTVAQNCRWVRVSLDAGTSETHNLLHRPRNKDQFSVIVENIRKLIQMKENTNPDLVVGVSFLAHPWNVLELSQLYSLCNSISVDYVQVKPILKAGRAKFMNIYALLSQMPQFIRRGKTELYINLPRFGEIAYDEKKDYDECLYSQLVITIGSEGNCYPCCQLVGKNAFAIGNINRETLRDIWYGSRRQKVIKSIVPSSCPVCRGHRINKLLNDYQKGLVPPNLLNVSCKHANFI